MKTPAKKIHQNVWGNWYGYEGGKRVAAFGESSEYTAEQNARRWLEGKGQDSRPAPGGGR